MLLFYDTAYVNSNGVLFFADDYYGHDARLAKALTHGYPYPRKGSTTKVDTIVAEHAHVRFVSLALTACADLPEDAHDHAVLRTGQPSTRPSSVKDNGTGIVGLKKIIRRAPDAARPDAFLAR